MVERRGRRFSKKNNPNKRRPERQQFASRRSFIILIPKETRPCQKQPSKRIPWDNTLARGGGTLFSKTKIPACRPVVPYLANPREDYNRKGDVSLKKPSTSKDAQNIAPRRMQITKHLEGCTKLNTPKDALIKEARRIRNREGRIQTKEQNMLQ